jgi:hypothetical protein
LRGRCARPNYSSIPGKSASNTDRTGAQGESEAPRRTPRCASCSSSQSPGRESKSRGRESKSGGRKPKAGGRESKARGRESKARGRESKIKSPNFLLRIEPFQGLAPTPTVLSLLRRVPSRAPRAAQGSLVRFGRFVVCLVFVFGVLRSLEASEGLAPFLIADARARFRPTLAAAGSLMSAQRKPRRRWAISPMTPRIRQADRSDVAARMRPASKRARSGLGLVKRAGASPSCLRIVSRCLSFQSHPFTAPVRGGCGRLPSGACERAFHPAMGYL